MALPGFHAEISLVGEQRFYVSTFSAYLATFQWNSVHPALPQGGRGCPSGTKCCGGFDDSGACNGDCCPGTGGCCGDGSCCFPPSRCCSTSNGSSTCSDRRTDPQNCGSCGNVCASGTCTNSQCGGCPA